MFGKAMTINVGVVVGGGLGFYLKETYFLCVKKKCAELEAELQELVRTRKIKEELLRTRRNESNGD